MIIINITKKDKNISCIEVSGHSGYDVIGKDIVCSAVSTAMYVTLGLIEKLTLDYSFTSDEKKPQMKLEILKHDGVSVLVLENLQDALESIANDYPKYVKIKMK